MKLNMGSGLNPLPGYVNVDKGWLGTPDVKHDLEQFPWPWPNDSVDEVVFYHSLEHMGRDGEVFIGIVKELYRVCRHGAVVFIAVPHPRHDNYFADVTHVRPVTPDVFLFFSKEQCRAWREQGAANQLLAEHHNVDFRVAQADVTLDEPWASRFKAGEMSVADVEQAVKQFCNVAREWRIKLEVLKA